MPDDNTLTPGNEDNQQQPAFDFEKSYNELRPAYTQATQRLSEYESIFDALSDPETQAQALELLGFQMDTGSDQQQETNDGGEWVDPLEQTVEELRSEVTELRTARELEADQREQQQLIEMRDNYIGESLDYIETELSRQQGRQVKFTAREEKVLGNLAIAMADDDGVPDVQGAYNELFGDEGIAATRRQPNPRPQPFPAPGGRSSQGSKPDLSTRAARAAYIDERIRAANQDY